jgi:hypothetical protein
MDLVPTIDIGDPSGADLAALDRAARDHGFFLLAGHGLDAVIERTWDITRQFFACDETVKGPIRRIPGRGLGYYDRELTKRRRDNKEVFDYIDPRVGDARELNQWPTAPDGFHTQLVEFFDEFAALAQRTIGVLANALGDPATFDDELTISRTSSTVRLNHYPVDDPVPVAERDGLAPLGETALGYHTDTGVLTLAPARRHRWIAGPISGTRLDRRTTDHGHHRGQSCRRHAGLDQRSLQGRRPPGCADDDKQPLQHPLLRQPSSQRRHRADRRPRSPRTPLPRVRVARVDRGARRRQLRRCRGRRHPDQ